MARKDKSYKPDWVPENAGKEFAVKIVKAYDTKNKKDIMTASPKRKQFTTDEYVKGVIKNDRTILARTITLIESNSPKHNSEAQNVLKEILPYAGKSLRIGITGFPGAGKSSLIETLGLFLIKEGYKVAVLAIDPSSTINKGSILGDKTRMERLAREENCFIRPSPSSGTLGGVANKTRETMLVCEAAGYDIILIETVGVGQSEVTVRSMVDFFLLVMIAGAGDELQGIKKGVIELADALIINKADGDNKPKALMAKADFAMALNYIQSATKGWKTEALIASALTGEGIPQLWEVIEKFRDNTQNSGEFYVRRKNQNLEWMNKIIEETILHNFYLNEDITKIYSEYKEKVFNEKLLPTDAAEKLLKIYFSK